MDIPEIANLPTAIEMKREILKLAMEKGFAEQDVWSELEIYRKTNPDGRRKRRPTLVSEILKKVLPTMAEVKITESPAEDCLKSELIARDMDFEMQKSIGKYRVDFFFPAGNLIVEVDGAEYHATGRQFLKDFDRDSKLMKRGYTVLRFWASEVFKDAEGCVLKIMRLLGTEIKPERTVYGEIMHQEFPKNV